MTRKPKLGMTGPELCTLREKHLLTQVQIAQLLRMSTFTRGKHGSQQSSQIGNWETGKKEIPIAAAELIRSKLYLLEVGVATFEELIRYPLDGLLRDLYS